LLKRFLLTSIVIIVGLLACLESYAYVPTSKITGEWHSNLGDVQIQQKGPRFAGKLTVANKPAVLLEGSIYGHQAHFVSIYNNRVYGNGALTLSHDGNQLDGNYYNHRTKHHIAFHLNRTTPIHLADITGEWMSNHGKIRLYQRGQQVTGTWHRSDGTHGKLTGQLQGQQLDFRWQVNQQAYGYGKLQIENNNQQMGGFVVDNAQRQQASLVLRR